MRYKTIVAASAAAAAAAAIPCGSASASTPDWLTLASLESDSNSMLPVLCGGEATGTVTDPVCESVLGTQQDKAAESVGEQLPDSSGGYYDSPTLANVDLRDFAKWQVCGIAVTATTDGIQCDNSITAEREPVRPDDGVSLVNANTEGAFNWSVCGVAVLQDEPAIAC